MKLALKLLLLVLTVIAIAQVTGKTHSRFSVFNQDEPAVVAAGQGEPGP